MDDLYLVTGATSYLGVNLVQALVDRGARVRGLVLPGDPLEPVLPEEVEVFHGDVVDPSSMEEFFTTPADADTYVIHCAGLVTIREEYDQRVINVNVGGTRNVVELCLAHAVHKLVHISSTSAIPLRPRGTTMSEVDHFDPAAVRGCYARSKAQASQLVLDAARGGLDASIIHPTGIFGPGCYGRSSLVQMVIDICTGQMRTSVTGGGADYVDARDLAGVIIACCHRGRRGECYIVGGHFVTMRRMFDAVGRVTGRSKRVIPVPASLLRGIAPVAEWVSRRRGTTPVLTSFSIFQLTCNMAYSTARARQELGLAPRPFDTTLKDTIDFLKDQGRLS